MITEEKYGPLAQMEVKDFVFTVGARSPSPGGGSVAALTASMVSNLYYFYIRSMRMDRERLI